MDLRKRFNNKHVVITGAAQGIGFEIACHFAREGALLSLLDLNTTILDIAAEKIKQLSPKVYTHYTDISVKEQVEQAVSAAEHLQPIDILINNAGIAFETPFLEIEEKEWQKIMDVNLKGMFLVSQSVCRFMAKRMKGVVVNMSSKNGQDGEFGYAHYNASKAGVIMLTKTMALELAHLNIRVNAVAPGYIQTPLSETIDSPEFTANFVESYIPMNRVGKPQEIAPLFLFLAGEESSFITGQVFVADGGQLAGQKPGQNLTGAL
ncbi:beta-ketoacyl-ACP reductase [Pedobacter sp. HMWF019]|uniref:SDR family NAD(P)-dependent oxidoreductase n=1 Tax=Pedobacter sp. HMWF019 TaxID=2056856 RepID=UPI000D3BC368|nr:SDR family NAD(P)-dependent oxidoreductase [Pedobacter sp. HMWF019]PTS94102.1 beta-ketoacyl-ACP reductase [Pedobacter sp. HMWF019]